MTTRAVSTGNRRRAVSEGGRPAGAVSEVDYCDQATEDIVSGRTVRFIIILSVIWYRSYAYATAGPCVFNTRRARAVLPRGGAGRDWSHTTPYLQKHSVRHV